MLAFGISPTMEENKDCLCRALSIQFRMFVGSNSDEVDDIVAISPALPFVFNRVTGHKTHHPLKRL